MRIGSVWRSSLTWPKDAIYDSDFLKNSRCEFHDQLEFPSSPQLLLSCCEGCVQNMKLMALEPPSCFPRGWATTCPLAWTFWNHHLMFNEKRQTITSSPAALSCSSSHVRNCHTFPCTSLEPEHPYRSSGLSYNDLDAATRLWPTLKVITHHSSFIEGRRLYDWRYSELGT